MRALIAVVLLAGCSSVYTPRVVARGELLLRYNDGFELHAGGERISHAPTWGGLPAYVRCVPPAADLAARARSHGQAGLALAIVGGVLGVAAIGSLAGLADTQNQWTWIGAGIGAATVGVVFSGVSRMLRNRSNQEAVDAHNHYNDVVGSVGASCADRRQ
jgi:hypothetical protein